jgi:hypothetical protein
VIVNLGCVFCFSCVMNTFIQISYLILLVVVPCSTQVIFSFGGKLLPVLQLQLEVSNCSDTMVNFYWTMQHSISKDFNHDFFVASDDDL